MLSTMRKGVSTIFAKALMLLLVLSFGLWGIGDMLRHNGSANVARVGDARISPQEFNDRLMRIKAQMQGMPPEMLDSETMRLQVLQGMVQQLLLLQEAQRIGMNIGHKTLASVIRDNPQFHDAQGTFNANAFARFLQSNRISEGMFLDSVKRDIESATVLQTLDIPQTLTFDALSHVLDSARAQSRSADIFIIPSAALADKAPADDELQRFYETVEGDYMLPESRTIAYVVVDKDAVDKQIEKDISEQAIEDRYSNEKENLGTPEKRDVTQLLFDAQEEADKAAKALRDGAAIGDVVKRFKVKNGEALPMRGISKDALPPEASENVFALKEGEASAPIETGFGWHVFKVEHITPGKVPAMAAVRGDIVRILVDEGREDALFGLAGKLEDAVAAGDNMEKAASGLGIAARAYSVQASAKEVPAGDTKDLKASAIKTGFGLEEGEMSGFVSPDNSHYLIATVTTITPQAAKPLADVRAEVSKRYLESERVRATAERASLLVTQLQQSGDPQAVADKAKLIRRSYGPVTLAQALGANGDISGIPAGLAQRLFDTELGAFTAPVRMKDGSWAIAKVTKISQSSEVAQSNSKPAKELTGTINGAVYANFLQYLTKRYPVHVNEELMKDNTPQP